MRLTKEIERYCEAHTTDEDPVLAELFRITHLKTVHPQMLSGKVQGQFLSMLSRMIAPNAILEIGTFTGYSAYCLVKGLTDGGVLTTIDVDDELESLTRDFFKKAAIEDKINYIIGDALQVIPRLDQMFDLIFIDANKEHYPQYLELSLGKLNSGGYIIADNTLWGGKVADEVSVDASAKTLDEFNKLIHNDARLENVMLTVRDGLTIARKRKIV